MNLEELHQVDVYRRHFMDARVWEPAVRQVCAAHGLACGRVRAGLAGTYPTFLVDERWVVKFFGRLFDGAVAFTAELAAHQLLAQDSTIPAARLVALGQLFKQVDRWAWPYLIFAFVPGLSMGEQIEAVHFREMQKQARWLGKVTRRLHQLSLKGNNHFVPAWEPFVDFLEQQTAVCVAHHQLWGHLPPHLIDQIPEFLLPVPDLVDWRQSPHLIHADLTADHLLGVVENGRFHPTGLIDFGDAMVGNIYYELVALHIDLFRCDKRLLPAFFAGYDLPQSFRDNFAVKAMCMTLLHRFDVMAGAVNYLPPLAKIENLSDLAALLWHIDRDLWNLYKNSL